MSENKKALLAELAGAVAGWLAGTAEEAISSGKESKVGKRVRLKQFIKG